MTIVRQYHAELHEQARAERAGREARATQATQPTQPTQAAEHATTAKTPAAYTGFLARVGALAHSSPKVTKPVAG